MVKLSSGQFLDQSVVGKSKILIASGSGNTADVNKRCMMNTYRPIRMALCMHLFNYLCLPTMPCFLIYGIFLGLNNVIKDIFFIEN